MKAVFEREGLWGETGRSTVCSLTARTGQPMGESQHPCAARPLLCSPMEGKTPLVLPYEGERRKGSGFAQPPGLGPPPLRERQRGSPSQGAAGHPLGRDRDGLPT